MIERRSERLQACHVLTRARRGDGFARSRSDLRPGKEGPGRTGPLLRGEADVFLDAREARADLGAVRAVLLAPLTDQAAQLLHIG